MSRRGSNIYKRTDGRYEGRIKIGYDENRKLRYKYVYGKTLSEVKEKMEQSYSLKKTEIKPFIKLTVKEVCSEWLESKRLTVKQSTYANYSRLLKNHIYPLWADKHTVYFQKSSLIHLYPSFFRTDEKTEKADYPPRPSRIFLSF